jgi:uncharacterized membrane protein
LDGLQCVPFVEEAREKVITQSQVGYVKESKDAARMQEAQERATAAEAEAMHSKSEVMDLTQVLNDKNKELEDIADEHKKVLAAALKEKDDTRTQRPPRLRSS